MREIEQMLGAIERWHERGDEIAVATLVRASGSCPRLPGARVCMTRAGETVGSISGGCVETDIVERARNVLDEGRAAVATYGVADDEAFRVGLTCGGDIDVLIEPLAAAAPWRSLLGALANGQPGALCTVLDCGDWLGRQLAVIGIGSACSTVGSIDAEIDERLAAEAVSMLPAGGTRVLKLECCGRDREIFIEAFPRPRRLIIVGATPVAMALSRAAAEVGFGVIVIDPRDGMATDERFPQAEQLVVDWPDAFFAQGGVDEGACVVALAHDSKFDVPTLAHALRSRAAYIGALGGRKTHARRCAALGEQGFGAAELSRIRAPIGLDIGARTPQEIAVSIIAEMLAVLATRAGCALTDRRAPIHAEH